MLLLLFFTSIQLQTNKPINLSHTNNKCLMFFTRIKLVYLKQISNVYNKSSRNRFNIHPILTILNLQPTNIVLLQHSQNIWIRTIHKPNRQIRLWALGVLVTHHCSFFQTCHFLQPPCLYSKPFTHQP